LAPINIEISAEADVDQLFYDPMLNRTLGVPEPDPDTVTNPGVSVKSSGVSENLEIYTYRPISRSEVSTAQRSYFSKVNMQYYDIETSQNLKIVDIVFCTSNNSGIGPKTPLFKMYDVAQFPGSPQSEDDFEYQPCREVLRSSDTRWDDVVNSAIIISFIYLLCILRDPSRLF